jgi:hypothetical protein
MGSKRYALQAANPWPACRPPEGWPSLGRFWCFFSYYQLVMLFVNMVCLTVALTSTFPEAPAEDILDACDEACIVTTWEFINS